MNRAQGLLLLLLSAVWGSSFLFMRIASSEFGAVPLIFVRVVGAALCLSFVWMKASERRLLIGYWKHLLVVGIVGSALPFSLLSFATLSLESGLTSLLNATTPLFAALVGFAWIRSPLSLKQFSGLILGFIGVAILSWDRLDFTGESGDGWSVLAGLGAGASYGFATHYSKRFLSEVPSATVAAGSMLGGSIAIFPLGLLLWPEVTPSVKAWSCALGLAIPCTAVAYLIFFRLLAKMGATLVSTVTYVIPVFAVVWGAYFLGEIISVRIVVGMVVTLMGTSLVIGVWSTQKQGE